jgi:hypothetical protein
VLRPSTATLALVLCSSVAHPACRGAGEDAPSPAESDPSQKPQGALGSGDAAVCEDLGALAASALTANVDASGDWFTMPLAGRPVPTYISVGAYGDPANLLGQSATLGAGVNDNYQTCTHCILIAVGCASPNDCSAARRFYATSGSAKFTALAGPTNDTFTGTFSSVVLTEVTIDTTTYRSTAVAAGGCLRVSSFDFRATVNAQSVITDAGGSSHDGGTSDGSSSSKGGGGGGGGRERGSFN